MSEPMDIWELYARVNKLDKEVEDLKDRVKSLEKESHKEDIMHRRFTI